MGAVTRISLYNMILILLPAIFAAIVVAISMIRHPISFGRFTRVGVAAEDVAVRKERVERLRIAGPIKQFLVVVLPDGKVVNPGLNLRTEPLEPFSSPLERSAL